MHNAEHRASSSLTVVLISSNAHSNASLGCLPQTQRCQQTWPFPGEDILMSMSMFPICLPYFFNIQILREALANKEVVFQPKKNKVGVFSFCTSALGTLEIITRRSQERVSSCPTYAR